MIRDQVRERRPEEDSRGGPIDAIIGGTALACAALAPAAPEGSTLQKTAIVVAAIGAIILPFRMR